MSKSTVLIVDDEPTHCKLFSKFVSNLGYDHLVMTGGMEVVDFFTNKKSIKGISSHDIDVMLLDLSMPDIDGITVLKQIAATKGDTQVIVLTANGDVSLAINAINAGAVDYVVKGDKDILARVTASISNAIEKKSLKYQVSNLIRKDKDQVSFSDIIGQSDAITNAIALAKKVTNSSVPVLIEGPNGVGKQLLAMAIHGSGFRSGKPFVIVECEGLKANAEEELFGSEKSLNGHSVKSLGKIREADNGTIFFDKIDSLKSDIQAKILRFMQDGEFFPVNSKEAIRCNVRVICSTDKDLEKVVAAKKFREDLFYRISSFPIKLPALKDRGEEDIKLLAESFCREIGVNENKRIKGITADALTLLYNFEWNDNVRQLKNVIFRAVVLCDDEMLKPEHFPNLLNKEVSNFTKTRSALKKKSDINSELIDIFDDEGCCKTIDQIEEEVIRRLLDIYNENLSEIAKHLNIGRSTIYRKLKILNNSDDAKG